MIEFRGELSYECKNYLLKVSKKMNLIVAVCVIVPFIIANILIAILLDWIYIIFLPALIIGIIIFWQAKVPAKAYGSLFPTAIILEDDNLYCELEGFTFVRNISNIKKVIDYGTFYHIVFHFPKKYINFICEKKLIINGTIEEFERMFESRVIKKF